MAISGEVTENPVTGERCRWLATSAETGGRSTRAEFWTRPGGGVPTMHVHREADEHFEVLAGELTAHVGDEAVVLRAGEHAMLPKGVPHRWQATGDEELHFVVEVTPAGNFEAGIETIFRMAREGKVRPNGFPRLLPFAAHHRMLLQDAYPASPPRWVLRLVLGVLEPFARWRLAATTVATMLVVLIIAAAATAAPTHHEARFFATIKGVQTVKWTFNGPTYTDCNGVRQHHGAGTEVVRFDSGAPIKLLIEGNTTPMPAYGTWDPHSLVMHPGFVAALQVTRQGRQWGTTSGGWCAGPTSQDAGAPYDCGQRKDTTSAYLSFHRGGKLEVDTSTVLPKRFARCPITAPSGVSAGSFTAAIGRLSNKLLFGTRKRIVVTGGKQYEQKDQYLDSTATTYFRLVLMRQ